MRTSRFLQSNLSWLPRPAMRALGGLAGIQKRLPQIFFDYRGGIFHM